MLARKVKDWKKSFAESTIEQIAKEHDCEVQDVLRVKKMIDDDEFDDDVGIYIDTRDPDDFRD